MGRAQSLINKLNAALNRVGPSDRTVYKRITTRTGGDSLIGRSSSVTYTETEFSPQPQYSRVTRYVVGEHVPSEYVLDSSNTVGAAVDYMFMFSPTAISKTDLQNPDMTVVLKDSSGNEEVFRVTDLEPIALNGTDVMYLTYARSTKQP